MPHSRLPKDYCNLHFDTPITSWDEALPLGNGLIGCLIWGPSDGLRLSLDRGDLWDTTPFPGILEEDFNFKTLVQFAKEKNQQAIREKFDSPYSYPTPTKLPAGKIIFHFKENLNVTSHLDIRTATATIDLGNDETKLQTYLHATQKTGFIKISGDTSSFSFTLENPEFGVLGENSQYTYDAETREISQGSLKLLKYPLAKKGSKKNLTWFVQPVHSDFTYGILIGMRQYPTHQEIIYRIGSTCDGEDWFETEKAKLLVHLDLGYDMCFLTHKQWWEDFWNKSAVCLPDKMFEKNWYLTNYFFGSCSRKGCPPMPLQGVWTADNGQLPPWKGDYHHDLNTQMSYYHYLKANHLEEGESFLDFLWNLVPEARNFARSFYHSDGLCLPAVMSINALPLGGWPMYSLSITNQLWLCQSFERHYRFTGDKAFLREKVYPYFKETALCILRLLKLNEAGYYELPISSSPELHDDEIASWVTPNSNYDLSMMLYLFTHLVSMAKELSDSNLELWEETLSKLPKLAINDKNILMISPTEILQESQRHFAHLMCIHPLRLLDSDKEEDKIVIDASISDLQTWGTSLWVGFSFPWMSELFAIQKDGEGAYHQLQLFWNYFCSPNGFHLNGDYKDHGLSSFKYRPFTLEANMCSADALQEMLLQTKNNKIEVFPAIPDTWLAGEISFEDLRGERGILISASLRHGYLDSITLKPLHTGEYQLVNSLNVANLQITPDCPMFMEGSILHLQLTAHTIYTFSSL